MPTINIEIKARCADADSVRRLLLSEGARFAGTDHQTDTYFHVPHGRLKLREGNIENNLIFYERNNQEGPKLSSFRLVRVPDANALRETLSLACGVRIIVRKQREIYYIGNVKFHIDQVAGLGSFAEIEAFNNDGAIGEPELLQQCNHYMAVLGIRSSDLLSASYSDLLLDQQP